MAMKWLISGAMQWYHPVMVVISHYRILPLAIIDSDDCLWGTTSTGTWLKPNKNDDAAPISPIEPLVLSFNRLLPWDNISPYIYHHWRPHSLRDLFCKQFDSNTYSYGYTYMPYTILVYPPILDEFPTEIWVFKGIVGLYFNGLCMFIDGRLVHSLWTAQ